MNIFLHMLWLSCNSYTLPFSVSPSKESAVVKQKLSQEEEAKFKVTFSPNIAHGSQNATMFCFWCYDCFRIEGPKNSIPLDC